MTSTQALEVQVNARKRKGNLSADSEDVFPDEISLFLARRTLTAIKWTI